MYKKKFLTNILFLFIFFTTAYSSYNLDYEIEGHPLISHCKETEIYVKGILLEQPELDKSRVKTKILSGEFKGKIYETFVTVSRVPQIGFQLNKGEYALIKLEVNKHSETVSNAYIVDYYRLNRLPYLFLLLIIICYIFGGKRSLLTFTGIILKIVLIYFYLRLFLNYSSPFFLTLFFIFFTLLLVIIFNTKSIRKKINASLTAIISMTVIVLFAYYLLSLFKVNGFFDDYIQLIDFYLRNIGDSNITRFYINIFLAAILLSITGVIADISVSISASINEIYVNNPSLTFSELLTSGLKVGKDILSTEINTILLALYGSNFGLFIVSYYIQEPEQNFINSQMFSVIFANIFLGIFGIVFTLIIGTFCNSFLLTYKKY